VKKIQLNTPDKFWTVLLLLLVLMVGLPGCKTNEDNQQQYATVDELNIVSETRPPLEEYVEEIEPSGISITMLDVNQGLSILVEADGRNMLYDGGGRDKSSYVVAFLKEHGISSLDLLVASHYDSDHLEGLVGVLNTTPTNMVLCPDYTPFTHIFESFREKLAASGAEVVHPLAGDSFALGTAEIEVLSPKKYFSNNENNLSIVLKITYGDFSCLITGDAEKEAEQFMIDSGRDISAFLYVAGHHGSNTSSSAEFLERVHPEYVYISCGKNNDYGFPKEEFLERIKDCNAEIFRTDVQGIVACYSDGTSHWFTKQSCEDWSPGTGKTE